MGVGSANVLEEAKIRAPPHQPLLLFLLIRIQQDRPLLVVMVVATGLGMVQLGI